MTSALTIEEQNAFDAIVATAQQIVDDPYTTDAAELDTDTFDELAEKINESLLKDIDHRDVLIKELKALELELDEKIKERNETRSLLNKFNAYIPKFPHKRAKVTSPLISLEYITDCSSIRLIHRQRRSTPPPLTRHGKGVYHLLYHAQN
jgi:hypothetical protein